MTPDVHIHRDAERAALAAAGRFIALGVQAIAERGRFCVALAGGDTPRRMYELLAEAHGGSLDWRLVHVFFGDERCVGIDDRGSNYGMVRRCLLGRVNVPSQQVHRIEGELAPHGLAADRYERTLRAFFGAGASGPPAGATFDLVLLGLGTDGHTASLFPGSPALDERDRWAVHAQAPPGAEYPDRVTLTLPVIEAARRVMFLACGANKAAVAGPIVAGSGDQSWPAARVRCAGGIEWHLDDAAAGKRA